MFKTSSKMANYRINTAITNGTRVQMQRVTRKNSITISVKLMQMQMQHYQVNPITIIITIISLTTYKQQCIILQWIHTNKTHRWICPHHSRITNTIATILKTINHNPITTYSRQLHRISSIQTTLTITMRMWTTLRMRIKLAWITTHLLTRMGRWIY